MTCAKVVVTAELVLADGRTFHGRNDCRSPQPACPRALGEGYRKCETVCHQAGHAEVMAVWAARRAGVADGQLRGGLMRVAHKRVCEGCQRYCRALGIEWELVEGEVQA